MDQYPEVYRSEPGFRRFGVAIEGKEVLEDYEPLDRGFAVADRHEFTARVTDGILDMQFIPVAENPKISAIEVEIMQ